MPKICKNLSFYAASCVDDGINFCVHFDVLVLVTHRKFGRVRGDWIFRNFGLCRVCINKTLRAGAAVS
jgi:hypothetical protein